MPATAGQGRERDKLSAFVISYNRSALLRTCLSALAFADEIIVVDKSSTDDSVAVATGLADRVISVPWSPTVEETRGFALAQCSHDWVLYLDDDECLSPEAVLFIDRELRAPRADVYCLPLRHYILGRHEERAYYWPERHPRLFRRGCVAYRDTVHAGVVLQGGRTFDVPWDEGACIHHLSHRDTEEWVAKTNRYTSRPDRARPDAGEDDLIGFAHAKLDFWMARGRDSNRGDYPAAVAVLRAVYDMVDRVKTWEEAAGLDGHISFPRIARRLEGAYAAQLAGLARPRRGREADGRSESRADGSDQEAERHLRTAQSLAAALRAAKAERRELDAEVGALRAELGAMRASTSWRLTAPMRRVVTKWRRLAPNRSRRRSVRGGAEELAAAIRPEAIEFPQTPDPVVSVIVPTFGQVDFTLNCLAAIARDIPRASMEVLVMDDASPDPDVARLHRVRGIRVLANETNQGFIRSCNGGAQQARGEFLLFLNNDTQPLPGWLDAMVELMRRRPDAGAVGSKLLLPDGRLQEAGGIIWNDGRGWTCGRGDDPENSAYSYVREVDYVSGASLLVRRDLFACLGGFDELFAPAYCEDSDLAFRIRERGFKVLYQPRSRVVHFEGGTNGRDPNSGVKRFNDINGAKLARKWAHLLAAEHLPSDTPMLRACQRPHGREVVLFAAEVLPESGSALAGLVEDLLAGGAAVKLWTPSPSGDATREAWQQGGAEVIRPGGLGDWLGANGRELDRAILHGCATFAETCLPELRLGSAAEVAFLSDGSARVGWRERDLWRSVDLVLHPSAEDLREAETLEPAVESRSLADVSSPGRAAKSPAAARPSPPN